MGKFWGKEEDDILRNKYYSGSYDEMVKSIGRDERSIKNRAFKLGLKRKHKDAWSKNDIDLLREHFPNSPRDILINSLGRTWGAIRVKAVILGVRRESRYRMQEGTNHYFFDNWSNDMAYILGFISADGNINLSGYRMSIKLSNNDAYHLYNIRDMVAPVKTIRHGTNIKNNKKYVVLEVSSKYMCSKLINLGVVPRKSLILELPDVPLKYLSHFARGYFDGDGCIYRGKGGYWRGFFCSGSRNFLLALSKKITSLTEIKYRYPYRSKNSTNKTCALRFATYDSIKLGKWMYKDSTLHLDRKYNKFLQLYKEKDK